MGKIDLEAIQAKINANLPLPSESRPDTPRFTEETLPSKHPLHTLWFRFSEIYGHQWASQQGDSPTDTWIRGLEGLSNDQFGVGLRALLDRADTWPPNLVEFRQLCTGYDAGGWERQAHKIHEPERRLEDKTSKEKNKVAGNDVLTNLQGMF